MFEEWKCWRMYEMRFYIAKLDLISFLATGATILFLVITLVIIVRYIVRFVVQSQWELTESLGAGLFDSPRKSKTFFCFVQFSQPCCRMRNYERIWNDLDWFHHRIEREWYISSRSICNILPKNLPNHHNHGLVPLHHLPNSSGPRLLPETDLAHRSTKSPFLHLQQRNHLAHKNPALLLATPRHQRRI